LLSPKVAVAGHLGKDKLYKLDKSLFEVLGPSCPTEESIKFTQIERKFGISPEELTRKLGENSIYVRWSYGGRAGNVSYQIALLGGRPILITEVGRDFSVKYPGFWDGSYKEHLRKNGVSLRLTEIEREEELESKDQSSTGVLLVRDKELAEIVCVTDVNHKNLFFINDLTAATALAEMRKVPVKLLEEVDAVFVTSGSHKFNSALMKVARELGKEIYWDVGFFDLNERYVRDSVALVDTIFCNSVELGRICELSGYSVAELTKSCRLVVHEKTKGKAIVYDDGREMGFGPLKIGKKVSPIGCCDGFSAGFTFFDLQRRPLEECVLAALIISASVYGYEDVQTGMLSRSEIERKIRSLKSKN